jgi:hypothetical protein
VEEVHPSFLALPDVLALVPVEVETAPDAWKMMLEEVVILADGLKTMPVVVELWPAKTVLTIAIWVLLSKLFYWPVYSS